MVSGECNYVQINIDTTAEVIKLVSKSTISVGQVGAQIPSDEPRYHFFKWTHEYEEHVLNYIVFIYSCPDGSGGTKSAPVRQRTLYSSSKSNMINVATSAGVEVAGRFEINSGSEFSEDYLMGELHPKPVEVKKAFARPKAAGRGPPRLNNRD